MNGRLTLLDKSQGGTGAILFVAIVVVTAAGLGYYQFQFLPTVIAMEKESNIIPPELLPQVNVTINILDGSFDPNQEDNYVPKSPLLLLGFNNSVVWRNIDTVAHTVSHDPSGTVDPKFDKAAYDVNWLQPEDEWVFIFTKAGDYPYQCTPHPWMKASIIVQSG